MMGRLPGPQEDRRYQIIDAAIAVFSEKGFHKSSNKDIAKEAGITPGLIYHYFESKEALLLASIESRMPTRLLRFLPPDLFAEDPPAFLRVAMGRMLEVIEDEEFVPLMRIFLAEVIHNPQVSPAGTGPLMDAATILEEYLSSKIQSGELRQCDPAMASQMLMGCLMGYVIRRQIFHDPSALAYSQQEIVDTIIGVALEGFGG